MEGRIDFLDLMFVTFSFFLLHFLMALFCNLTSFELVLFLTSSLKNFPVWATSPGLYVKRIGTMDWHSVWCSIYAK
uniref:Uncharacterized protein n=1 Tax=Ixodes ricinus TaxID=34613 RepID=A0A6B0U489_IXORI